jgi:hypothetical protein
MLGAGAPCAHADTTQRCPDPTTLTEWSDEIAAAEATFAARDEAAFDAAMTRAATDLGCLDGIVEPVLAGRWHRLVALRLYARRDTEAARVAFAAAHAVDPFGAIPSALLPPGHEARTLSQTATTPGATVRAPRPRGGALYFDGREGLDRPADRPTVAQIDIGSRVVATEYLAPGDPLPPYAIANAHPTGHWITGGAGVAFGIATAISYGFALGAANTLDGPLPVEQYGRADVVALQRRANTLVIVSGTTGALAVGLGVATVVRW